MAPNTVGSILDHWRRDCTRARLHRFWSGRRTAAPGRGSSGGMRHRPPNTRAPRCNVPSELAGEADPGGVIRRCPTSNATLHVSSRTGSPSAPSTAPGTAPSTQNSTQQTYTLLRPPMGHVRAPQTRADWSLTRGRKICELTSHRTHATSNQRIDRLFAFSSIQFICESSIRKMNILRMKRVHP